jgi:tripeptidyl-peptidase I
MKLSFFVALGGLAATISAVPAPLSYTIHEKRDVLASPSQWQRRDLKLDRRTTIPMSIALTQRNLENGPDYLLDVSNPRSANYGKHWSSEQVCFYYLPESSGLTVLGCEGVFCFG